jgi:hypothetical protein
MGTKKVATAYAKWNTSDLSRHILKRAGGSEHRRGKTHEVESSERMLTPRAIRQIAADADSRTACNDRDSAEMQTSLGSQHESVPWIDEHEPVHRIC